MRIFLCWLFALFLWFLLADVARADEPQNPPGESWVIEHKFERCYYWITTKNSAGRFTRGSGSISCVNISPREYLATKGYEGLPYRAWRLFSDS